MKETEENVEIVDDVCRKEERHLASENHFNKFVVFHLEDFERISKRSSRRKT